MENENIVIRFGDMRAEVSPLGAELQSLKYQDREYLYDGSFDWTGRAPLLFPIAGRLRDDMYKIDGVTYPLPQHGFARRRVFALAEASENSVTFVLTDDAETRKAYPASFALYATYTLHENALEASVRVENRGDDALYFGFGNHEALVTSPDKSEYSLHFDFPEDLTALNAENGLLTGGGVDLGRGVCDLSLKSDYFEEGATLIFKNLNSRAVTLLHREKPVLRLNFDAPHLLVWCKSPMSPFLCIEPWINLPDAANTNFDLSEKPGVVALASGESATVSHTLTLLNTD